ncbi:adenylyl-sulfate kinase [Clostridia bacterium]|nr:adenylyl-sulfate kinase [Clostridia bacterium]
MELLKFITCGSVDDGKSTLIGHMLYDAKLIFTDQEKALELESRVGSRDGAIDYSLLLDGLMAEREQGITIDVAYRFFSTDKRSFIVADCPGHEQYTRNMAVGASFADLAVLLVDATQGIQLQTKRHARICALMGIRHILLAVNKMDLIHYDKNRFEEIKREFQSFAAVFDLESLQVIPVSATAGDNVTNVSKNMPWYDKLPLLQILESIDVTKKEQEKSFIMPVQRVSRPNQQFRGFQGQIESGTIRVGDEVLSLPSQERARVKDLYLANKCVDEAGLGQPVTIQLDKEVDVSRGCVLASDTKVQLADLFEANLLWMDDHELVEGRSYLIKCGTKLLPATIFEIKYRIDVHTGKQLRVEHLIKNEIGVCTIALSENMVFEEFRHNQTLGSFILMDRVSNMTSACGTINHSMRRSTNVFWEKTTVTPEVRARQKNQQAGTIWLTGLSGSGKSTIANALESKLMQAGKHTMILDGDNIRHGLNRNLGFTEEDRIENIRRVAEVARLMNEAGLLVMVALISPYREDREQARTIVGKNFLEVYVDTPMEVCEKRDVKGLYLKARKGEIPNFTGISSPYEEPLNPDVRVDTSRMELSDIVKQIEQTLLARREWTHCHKEEKIES